jgi:hypothetical protein
VGKLTELWLQFLFYVNFLGVRTQSIEVVSSLPSSLVTPTSNKRLFVLPQCIDSVEGMPFHKNLWLVFVLEGQHFVCSVV